MPRFVFLSGLLLLGGCASVAPAGGAGGPIDQPLPGCVGFDDAAITEVINEIDAAWARGLSQAEVLGVGFASGCVEQCLLCWADITNFVFFELH